MTKQELIDSLNKAITRCGMSVLAVAKKTKLSYYHLFYFLKGKKKIRYTKFDLIAEAVGLEYEFTLGNVDKTYKRSDLIKMLPISRQYFYKNYLDKKKVENKKVYTEQEFNHILEVVNAGRSKSFS